MRWEDGLIMAMAALGTVLLPEAPPYHAGMFMMPAGEGRMAVGDPSLGRALFAAGVALSGRMLILRGQRRRVLTPWPERARSMGMRSSASRQRLTRISGRT